MRLTNWAALGLGAAALGWHILRRRRSHVEGGEAPIRYLLAGGRVGVPDRLAYAHTLVGLALFCGAPPQVARLLACCGACQGVQSLQRWWARGVRRYLHIQLDIAGLAHIEPGVRYVVTPLHEGFADAIALLHLPLPLRFVVRDELLGWPLLGPYLRATRQIAICPERGARAYRALLRQAADIEDSLLVFPQGSILGVETDFTPGAFALARALRRPILPVALTGSHRVWEHPYTPRLRFGQRMSMHVLPPIAADAVRAAGVEELRADTQRRLKDAALSGAMAPPRRFVPARDGYWDGYAYRIDPRFAELAKVDVRQLLQQGCCTALRDARLAIHHETLVQPHGTATAAQQ